MNDRLKKLLQKNDRTKDFYAQQVNKEVSNKEYKYNEEIAILRKAIKKLIDNNPSEDYAEFLAYFNRIEQIKQEVKDDIDS